MLNVCCIRLTVQQVSNLQVCNCKTLKTLAMTPYVYMDDVMYLLQLELVLLVTIRIRLDIHLNKPCVMHSCCLLF